MPVSTLNGWTSSGLLPSSTVVSQILSRAGSGAQAPGSVIPPVAPGGISQGRFSNNLSVPPVGSDVSGGGYAPIPSVPPQQPPGFGGANRGMPMDPTGGRGWVNPALTPEQAYSQYLQWRGFADTTTPLQASINNLMGAQNQLAYGGFAGDPNRNGLNYDPYGQTLRNNLAAQMMGAQRASPYAYSYGTPAAHAPAAAPAGGYATGYGVQPPGTLGGGFGFGNSGGFGF